ncbi:MAG TPA: mycothiol system anti-sigma-R factor [Acidimicrobiales bacterium]|nr:mycothiol system anti-sigma-R factor [Acidimicrobiales bacterium]
MGEDCGQAIERLYYFLDGELTEDRRVEIRQHLDDCGPCLSAFDFEAELRVMISVRCRDEVPEALRARVAAAIQAEAQRRSG